MTSRAVSDSRPLSLSLLFAERLHPAFELGFRHVESGPLVRSSYHARDQVPDAALKALRRRATVDAEGRVVAAT